MTFDDVRINNVCKNLDIATIGDLHQTDQKELLSMSNAEENLWIELIQNYRG